ncbi:MAG: PAS domain-containing protein [Roseococcus sp.]|nr:PAS domain-containing protein [Roseococcus sp.]
MSTPTPARPERGRSFRSLMVRAALVVALPLFGVALLSTLDGVRRERLRFEEQMAQTARAMAIALDGEIARVEHGVRNLARTLERDTHLTDAMMELAVGREVGAPALGLALGPEGQKLAVGMAWPEFPPGVLEAELGLDPAFLAAALDAPGTLLSDVLRLPGGTFAVAAARALAPGQSAALVVVVVPSTRLGLVLRAQSLPDGWIAAVVDRQGRVAARTRGEAEFVGAMAMPRTLAMLAEAEAGVLPNSTTHDGMNSTTAAARAPRSGYAVVMAAPAPGALQDLQSVLGLPALAGALLVGGAIWGAQRVSARFLAGVASLAPGAPPNPSGVLELDDAAARLRAAEAAQAAAMDRLERSEARYRIATEAFAGGIYECRPGRNHVTRSPGHITILGEETDEPVREWWLDRIHPEDRDRLGEALAAVRTGATDRFELEYRVRHRQGHFIWVWHRSIAHRDTAGEVRIVGSVTDITTERTARDTEELIAREMDHRVKNSFALIASLVSLTAASWPEADEFAAELRQRVLALTAAHELVRHGAQGATLHGLIRQMAAPYEPASGASRIHLQGDDVALRPGMVPQFGLMLHECLTNAAKYGSLSVPGGHLRIATHREGREMRLEWEESGGPAIVETPEEMGFGSVLLASTIQSLDARLERDWRPEGLRFTLDLPLDQLEATPVRPAHV